jgi:hypothetical protein
MVPILATEVRQDLLGISTLEAAISGGLFPLTAPSSVRGCIIKLSAFISDSLSAIFSAGAVAAALTASPLAKATAPPLTPSGLPAGGNLGKLVKFLPKCCK